jgi:hypothetical protein
MKPVVPKPQRCAIYTRKSTEHNLDCPKRTGLRLGTERQWFRPLEHQRLFEDPAPPALSLVWGFGGGGARRRFNRTKDFDRYKNARRIFAIVSNQHSNFGSHDHGSQCGLNRNFAYVISRLTPGR